MKPDRGLNVESKGGNWCAGASAGISYNLKEKVMVMKTNQTWVALLAAVALVAGCNKPADEKPAADKPAVETSESANKQLNQIKQETKAVASDIKDYAYAQKAEFVDKMRGDLDKINQELDQLSTKLETASDTVKADGKAKVQDLREQLKKLNQQLDGVKDASESGWNDFKAGFRKSLDSMKDSLQQARQWLSDKIAP